MMRKGITRYNSEIEKCKRKIEPTTQNFSLYKEYLNTASSNADTQYQQGFEQK
jgi:hypothetical protein